MGEALYDQVGGEEFFVRLVDLFYDAVEVDEVLRPMYPDDLSESKRHLALFLAQYWGGPRTYEAERGHPRLRLRHAPFQVTKRARDAWFSAMTSALDQLTAELTSEQYDELVGYFTMAATQMRNV